MTFIASNRANFGHSANFNDFSILSRCSNVYQRRVIEEAFIKFHDGLTMNLRAGKYNIDSVTASRIVNSIQRWTPLSFNFHFSPDTLHSQMSNYFIPVVLHCFWLQFTLLLPQFLVEGKSIFLFFTLIGNIVTFYSSKLKKNLPHLFEKCLNLNS